MFWSWLYKTSLNKSIGRKRKSKAVLTWTSTLY